MSIWFTSDWHLGHNKDFIYKTRGFSSVNKMDKTILQNYNKVVKPEDTVYILGDCTVCGLITPETIDFLQKFQGHKHLIIGNHDTPRKIESYRESDVFDSIEHSNKLQYKSMTFWLSHHPLYMYNNEDGKSTIEWDLHGHIHTDEVFSKNPYCYNVNVEAHDFYPVNIEEIYQTISKL